MVRRIWQAGVGLVVCLCCTLPLVATQKIPPGFVAISGRDEPARIPQYLLWREGFRGLANAITKDIQPFLNTLDVPSPDRERIHAEALAQIKRDAACEQRQKARQDELLAQKVKPDVIHDAVTEVAIACRVEVIEARDRLLAAIHPDNQPRLMAWIELQRSGITMYVPERDLKTFFLPQ